MPRGWQWDETLFQGSAVYYERGRIPYAPGLADTIAAALGLDGRGRLIDVGCGPGTIALRLAHLFEEVVGLDADAEMVAEAERQAGRRGIGNARWVRALAEELPAGLGAFRAATFAQSFHWMDRDRVATAVFALLEPGGAFIQVNGPTLNAKPAAGGVLPYPLPPYPAIEELERAYLGPERRAGQGVLRYGTPDNEAAVLARAGFDDPEVLQVPGPAFAVRSVDDLVAARFSMSGSAPHLFGGRLPEFEAELRAVLTEASPAGLFAEPTADTEVRVWRTSRRG